MKLDMAWFLKCIRSFIKCMFVYALAWTGSLRRAERHIRHAGGVVTLTFHRVLDDASYGATNSLPGIIIRERTFQQLVRYVVKNYEPVAFGQVSPGDPSRRLRMAFTFDDGWRDSFTTAFPIIAACKVPVTLFICPGVLGKTTPFWPEQAMALLRTARPQRDKDCFSENIESLKRNSDDRERYLAELKKHTPKAATTSPVDMTLSWDEIVKMHEAGICFGSHTDTHQILTSIPTSVARTEMSHSKAILEQVLGTSCVTFAYPNGNSSPFSLRTAKELGFTRAVTTERGIWTSSCDPLTIPRMNVCESGVVGVTGKFWPPMFKYTVLWKAWRAYRTTTLNRRSKTIAHIKGPSSDHMSPVDTRDSLSN